MAPLNWKLESDNFKDIRRTWNKDRPPENEDPLYMIFLQLTERSYKSSIVEVPPVLLFWAAYQRLYIQELLGFQVTWQLASGHGVWCIPGSPKTPDKMGNTVLHLSAKGGFNEFAGETQFFFDVKPLAVSTVWYGSQYFVRKQDRNRSAFYSIYPPGN